MSWSRTPIRDAVAVVISAVLASVLVVLLLPPTAGEAVEFLVWTGFFGASFWLLDRVMSGRFWQPSRASSSSGPANARRRRPRVRGHRRH